MPPTYELQYICLRLTPSNLTNRNSLTPTLTPKTAAGKIALHDPLSDPQVVGCKDTIAQSYLMDCLIQVFPDEFHLASLEAFLDGVCRLKEKVRVRPVLESLMERIGNYVEEHPDALPKDVSGYVVVWLLCVEVWVLLWNTP